MVMIHTMVIAVTMYGPKLRMIMVIHTMMVIIFSTHTTTTIIMARHIDDNNGDDVDAYEGDTGDSAAYDDDDGEVRAAAANSPSRASPPALSLANVTKVLRIIISMIVIKQF